MKKTLYFQFKYVVGDNSDYIQVSLGACRLEIHDAASLAFVDWLIKLDARFDGICSPCFMLNIPFTGSRIILNWYYDATETIPSQTANFVEVMRKYRQSLPRWSSDDLCDLVRLMCYFFNQSQRHSLGFGHAV